MKRRKMYDLTYRLKKKYPVQKKRQERVFEADRELAMELQKDKMFSVLCDNFDFTIQTTIK